MKLCKDCKYFDPYIQGRIFWVKFYDHEYSKCKHGLSINVVSGEGGQYCNTSRSNSTHIKHCTPEGRYWEAK